MILAPSHSQFWFRFRQAAARARRLPNLLRAVLALQAGWHPGLASGAARWRVLGAGLAAAPLGLRWLWRGDPASRIALRTALGLSRLGAAPVIDAALLKAREGDPRPGGPVTLVLPVFNARDCLDICLTRIVAHTDGPWHLIVVEDASTDPGLRPWLRQRVAALRAAGNRVTLIENAANLGFVDSANLGLAAALADGWTGPVVLLNSDAFVPDGWAGRLTAPLDDPQVASVTPLSNSAALLSAPHAGPGAGLPAGGADRIDATLAVLDPRAAVVDVPAGVGFCMAIARDWLRRAPQFDRGFGRGYGEETDWCLRVAAMGGRHVAQGAVFVEHRGGASFGGVGGQALRARNAAILSRRHPGFDAAVQRFLAGDPAIALRLAAGFAGLAAGGGVVPVYVAHGLGGGAEAWLQARLAADSRSLGGAVVLRLGGPARCLVGIRTAAGETWGSAAGLATVGRLMDLLPRRRLVLSSLVGDPDPAEVLGWIAAQSAGGAAVETVVHDHHPISPSFTLLDSDGVYRGLPGPDATDPAHRLRRPDGTVLGLAGWQAAWLPVLSAADRITCFSQASRDLLLGAYPMLADRAQVRPLAVPPILGPDQWRRQGVVLGVPGNILPHKGAAVVAALARRGRAAGVRVVVIGSLDPAQGCVSGLRVTGSYAPADLPRIGRREGVTHWLIPSVWPETFSFTTHEALATGLPVYALDLGAQGAAVRAAANGIAVPYVPGADHAQAILAALTGRPAGCGAPDF